MTDTAIDAELDVLLGDAPPTAESGGIQATSAVTTDPTVAKGVVKRLNYSHKAMIDLIIAYPGISQNSIALQFGYSASWVSQVMASDAFQALLAERTDELVDPSLRLAVKERFEGMMRRSMEIIQEKLNGHPSTIPDQLALRTFELTSRAAGYGIRSEQLPKVPPAEIHLHLEAMGSNLEQLLRRKRALVIEQESHDDK